MTGVLHGMSYIISLQVVEGLYHNKLQTFFSSTCKWLFGKLQ